MFFLSACVLWHSPTQNKIYRGFVVVSFLFFYFFLSLLYLTFFMGPSDSGSTLHVVRVVWVPWKFPCCPTSPTTLPRPMVCTSRTWVTVSGKILLLCDWHLLLQLNCHLTAIHQVTLLNCGKYILLGTLLKNLKWRELYMHSDWRLKLTKRLMWKFFDCNETKMKEKKKEETNYLS